MEVAALTGIAPDFDWKLYFTSLDESQLTSLNVGMPDFFKAMDQVITTSSLPQLKSYLRLHIINGNAPWLSDNFYQANFNFFAHELQGQDSPTPQWKRCTRLTDQNLGEAVGQDWVKQYFPAKSKADMEQARRRAQEVAWRGHSNPALDDRRNQEASRGQARALPPEDRLSGHVAGLFQHQGRSRPT